MKKLSRIWNEAKILTAVQNEITDIEKGSEIVPYMMLNSIREKAARMMCFGKISNDFYHDIFCPDGEDYTHHWADINRDKIKNYVLSFK